MNEMLDCNEMVDFFNRSVIELIDHYLPPYAVKRHSTDKPWVNDKFRRLIRCRQYAFVNGDDTSYRKHRNEIQRLTKLLRKRYYTNVRLMGFVTTIHVIGGGGLKT